MAPKGFTLLELLVVLALVALVLALVPPMFSRGVSGTELRATARIFTAELRGARSEAIARNAEVAFTIDVEAGSYGVGAAAGSRRVPEGLTLVLVTAESEQVGLRRGSIRFFPDGSSTGGRITVSRGDKAYDVTVDWLTGRVSLGQ